MCVCVYVFVCVCVWREREKGGGVVWGGVVENETVRVKEEQKGRDNTVAVVKYKISGLFKLMPNSL